MTERIEAQIERFAPGFRDVILARSTRGPGRDGARKRESSGREYHGRSEHVAAAGMETDMAAVFDSGRWIIFGLASTPPGAGVHGMCSNTS